MMGWIGMFWGESYDVEPFTVKKRDAPGLGGWGVAIGGSEEFPA